MSLSSIRGTVNFVEQFQSTRRRRAQADDPSRVQTLWIVPGLPRSSTYDPKWFLTEGMGAPNVLWLTELLTQRMDLAPGMRVLDLGCGTAQSSIFLAREFDLQVWAADLWVDPTANWRRIVTAGAAGLVHPIAVEAHNLPFADGFFDAVVSMDAYHYFGTDERYLPSIVSFLVSGGQIGFVAPGNAVEIEEVPNGLPVGFPPADFFTFRSAQWWERMWRRSGLVEVQTAEMVPGGHSLWERSLDLEMAWFGIGENDLASGDLRMLDSSPGQSLGFSLIVGRRSSTDGRE